MENYDKEEQGFEPLNTAPQPEPERAHEPQVPQQEEASQAPEAPQVQEVPQQAAYHTHAGRKASPFADSPYVMNHDPVYQSQTCSAPVREKPQKKKGNGGRIAMRLFAAMLVVALVMGCCGITARSVNDYWKKRTAEMENSLNQKLEQLEQQIKENSNESSGESVSGSPVLSEGLTPGQLYAQCKNFVVAISSTIVSGQSSGTSSGSGFILTEDGYIITNYHVIEGASNVTVVTYDGDEYPAQVRGYDSTNDLAVLKIEAQDLQAAPLGSSNDLIIGDMVVAIGNPLGELTSTQTVGYVSGKDREISTDGTIINMLQTDAAINPGNSGGPLFNMNGEVVGITTAKYSGTTSSGASIEGIGFAIPIDDVRSMIDDIITKGYVSGAYLGVVVRNVDSSATAYGVPYGACVDSVTSGSCAQHAGIQAKDIIISVGSYEVESITDLTRALRNFAPGDTTTLVVWRSGQQFTLNVTFDERPREEETVIIPERSSDLPQNGSFDEWWDYFFGDSDKNG